MTLTNHVTGKPETVVEYRIASRYRGYMGAEEAVIKRMIQECVTLHEEGKLGRITVRVKDTPEETPI